MVPVGVKKVIILGWSRIDLNIGGPDYFSDSDCGPIAINIFLTLGLTKTSFFSNF